MYPVQTIPQARQIVDEGIFHLIGVFQLMYEGLTELEYHHFAIPKESVDLGNSHPWLLNRLTTTHMPHDGNTRYH